jgi:transmembrane sensor
MLMPKNSTSIEQRSIRGEAAEWLATLEEPCSDEQRRAFAAWLKRSNLHVEEFLRLSTLVHQVKRHANWREVNIDALVAQTQCSANVVPLREDRVAARSRRFGSWPALAAAACVLVVAAWGLATFLPAAVNSGTTLYSTAIGEQRSIALADGSVVELNTQSAVRTRFTATERAVELVNGEAIFRVAKDPQRPFMVISGAARIVAVGTAFNVNARSGGAVVTVLEGRVRVSNRAELTSAAEVLAEPEELEVARGEQATIVPSQPISRLALLETETVTSWTQRRLVFEDEPLSSVVAEFARYYDAKIIRIADAALGARRITGVFDAGDPGALVQFLENYSDVEIRSDERGWIIASTHATAPLAGIKDQERSH